MQIIKCTCVTQLGQIYLLLYYFSSACKLLATQSLKQKAADSVVASINRNVSHAFTVTDAPCTSRASKDRFEDFWSRNYEIWALRTWDSAFATPWQRWASMSVFINSWVRLNLFSSSVIDDFDILASVRRQKEFDEANEKPFKKIRQFLEGVVICGSR